MLYFDTVDEGLDNLPEEIRRTVMSLDGAGFEGLEDPELSALIKQHRLELRGVEIFFEGAKAACMRGVKTNPLLGPRTHIESWELT